MENLKKGFKVASLLMLVCVLSIAFVPTAMAVPVNKVTYSTYTISNVKGTNICTVHFSNGQTAYNTYNLQASRNLINSRILSFSKQYGLGITQAQIISRTNYCYTVRVSYKSLNTVNIRYP